jgi:hypothetical protein
MAGLVPAIHVLPVLKIVKEDVDARHKAGHDEREAMRFIVMAGHKALRHGRTCSGHPRLTCFKNRKRRRGCPA